MRASKRDELVQKAMLVFYEHGFAATGMDMLVKQTGVSKTSMYKYFRTKDDLILAALRLRDEQFRNWLYRRMEELGPTAATQLLSMFDALQEWFGEIGFKGCMFVKAAAEFQISNHPIYVQSAEHKRLLLSHLHTLCEEAGASDPALMSRQLMILKEGAIVSAQMGFIDDAAIEAKAAAEILMRTDGVI